MCSILRCCGWLLDFLQRILTFLLACILCFFITCGILIVVTAGIAYGYHYFQAEYITFAKERNDVSIYVRRGQFHDKPDMHPSYRRSGDENAVFSDSPTDYQDTKMKSDAKPLSDSWLKAQDSRGYAEKLTKYGEPQKIWKEDMTQNKDTRKFAENNVVDSSDHNSDAISVKIVTIKPSLTSSPDTQDTRAHERDNIPLSTPTTNLEDEYGVPDYGIKVYNQSMNKVQEPNRIPDIKIIMNDFPEREDMPVLRYRNSTKSPASNYPEDVEDDVIIYKSV